MDLDKHESIRQRLERATGLQRRWTGWASAGGGRMTPDGTAATLQGAPVGEQDTGAIKEIQVGKRTPLKGNTGTSVTTTPQGAMGAHGAASSVTPKKLGSLNQRTRPSSAIPTSSKQRKGLQGMNKLPLSEALNSTATPSHAHDHPTTPPPPRPFSAGPRLGVNESGLPSPAKEAKWESTPRSNRGDAHSPPLGLTTPSMMELFTAVLTMLTDQGKISGSGNPGSVAVAMSSLEAMAAIFESETIHIQGLAGSKDMGLGSGDSPRQGAAAAHDFHCALGLTLRKVFETVRSAVYADSVPFMSDTTDGTLKGAESWLSWLLERTSQFRQLTTQQQVTSNAAGKPLLVAHSEAYMSSMKNRHRRGMSDAIQQQAGSSSFQAVRMSFRDRRTFLGKHFKGWKTIVKHQVSARAAQNRMDDLRDESCIEVAFYKWKSNVMESLRSQRNEDMYRCVRVWKKETESRRTAEANYGTSNIILHELQTRIESLESEVAALQYKLDDLNSSPMVMDFRSSITDHKTGESMREGVVRFKLNSAPGTAGGKQSVIHDEDDEGADRIAVPVGDHGELFFDLISVAKQPGVAQPRREALSSHYLIRVDRCEEVSDPSLDWLHNGALQYCKNRFRPNVGNSNAGSGGWEAAILEQYSEFLEEKRSFVSHIQKRALALKADGGKNRCILLTEPRPDFMVNHPGELSRKSSTYLAAAHHWMSTAASIATQQVVASKLSAAPVSPAAGAAPGFEAFAGATSPLSPTPKDITPQGFTESEDDNPVGFNANMSSSGNAKGQLPLGNFGTCSDDVHNFVLQLGCAQQVSQEDFATNVESVHRLILTRLHFYATLSRALDRDQAQRAIAKAKAVAAFSAPPLAQDSTTAPLTRVTQVLNANEGPAVSRRTRRSSSTIQVPPAVNEKGELTSPLQSGLMTPPDLAGGGDGGDQGGLPIGPSGVLRLKQCRSLLGMVTQRDGKDYTEDRSALEVLSWVRQILTAARATGAPMSVGAKKGRSRSKTNSPSKLASQRPSTSLDFGNSSFNNASFTSASMVPAVRSPTGPAPSPGAVASEVNIRNLEEDFGDGLELLVSLCHHLCPASHVPTVSSTFGGVTFLEKAAEYLVRTAVEEMKAHIPLVVREQLHTCTPSIKLLYLSSVYNALHHHVPVPAGDMSVSMNPLERSMAGSMGIGISINVPSSPAAAATSGTANVSGGGYAYNMDKITHHRIAGPAPYINNGTGTQASIMAGLPPCHVKNSRIMQLFGKSQAVDSVGVSVTKLWPLIFAFFSRRFFCSPLRSHSAVTDVVALDLEGAIALCDDLGILPKGMCDQQAGGPLGLVHLHPQLGRFFLQSCVMADDELRDDSKDLRTAWSRVTNNQRSKLMRPTSVLHVHQVPEFVVRVTAYEWPGIQAPVPEPAQQPKRKSMGGLTLQPSSTATNIERQPQLSYAQWLQQNINRVVKAMKDLSHRVSQAHHFWIGLETSLSGRGHTGHSAIEAIQKTSNQAPFKLVDPRSVRSHHLFTPDVLRTVKVKSSTLVNLFIRNSFFTVHTWKMLDQREMTCQQWLKLLTGSGVLDIVDPDQEEVVSTADGGRRNSLHASGSSKSMHAMMSSNFTTSGTVAGLDGGTGQGFVTTNAASGGFHTQAAVTLSDGFLARIFGYVATARQVKVVDSLLGGNRPPAQTVVEGSAPLELKQPLSAGSGGGGGASKRDAEGHPLLTLGYSGFVEAVLVLAQCLHPMPWLAPADRLSLLIRQFERKIPETTQGLGK